MPAVFSMPTQHRSIRRSPPYRTLLAQESDSRTALELAFEPERLRSPGRFVEDVETVELDDLDEVVEEEERLELERAMTSGRLKSIVVLFACF